MTKELEHLQPCDSIKELSPAVTTLKTQMNIGIALLSCIVALLGTQTLYQIPRQDKVIVAIQKDIDALKKSDSDIREEFKGVYDSNAEMQSLVRQMKGKIKSKESMTFGDWLSRKNK